jgi:hypothetical protein
VVYSEPLSHVMEVVITNADFKRNREWRGSCWHQENSDDARRDKNISTASARNWSEIRKSQPDLANSSCSLLPVPHVSFALK